MANTTPLSTPPASPAPPRHQQGASGASLLRDGGSGAAGTTGSRAHSTSHPRKRKADKVAAGSSGSGVMSLLYEKARTLTGLHGVQVRMAIPTRAAPVPAGGGACASAGGSAEEDEDSDLDLGSDDESDEEGDDDDDDDGDDKGSATKDRQFDNFEDPDGNNDAEACRRWGLGAVSSPSADPRFMVVLHEGGVVSTRDTYYVVSFRWLTQETRVRPTLTGDRGAAELCAAAALGDALDGVEICPGSRGLRVYPNSGSYTISAMSGAGLRVFSKTVEALLALR